MFGKENHENHCNSFETILTHRHFCSLRLATNHKHQSYSAPLPKSVLWSTWWTPLTWLEGSGKKFQMTPSTIPNNTYLVKVAVELSHGLPDVKVLPLGVVSLAGLHPDVRRGVWSKFQMTQYYP